MLYIKRLLLHYLQTLGSYHRTFQVAMVVVDMAAVEMAAVITDHIYHYHTVWVVVTTDRRCHYHTV